MAADDTDDLRIGKGIVYFSPDNESNYRDLGFVPSFSITADITEKDYISAREGIATVALTITTKLKNTVKLRIDSINADNLAMFAMADVEDDTDGTAVLLSLSKTRFVGYLKVVGTNDVGNKINWIAKVTMRPSGDFNLISDGEDITGFDLEATVIRTDAYEYGKFSVIDETTV